jgi:hypothetical protein
MTNDQAPMTNQTTMPKKQCPNSGVSGSLILPRRSRDWALLFAV